MNSKLKRGILLTLRLEEAMPFSRLRLKKEPPKAGISKEGGASRHILALKGTALSARTILRHLIFFFLLYIRHSLFDIRYSIFKNYFSARKWQDFTISN
jgi:hypothetical protein